MIRERWEERCAKHAGLPRVPEGFSVESAAGHPTYRHYLAKGARCELAEGHEGPHRNGLLVWHDPPLFERVGRVVSDLILPTVGREVVSTPKTPAGGGDAEDTRANRYFSGSPGAGSRADRTLGLDGGEGAYEGGRTA